MAGSTTIAVSGENSIDALLTVDEDDANIAYLWDTTSLTYSFPNTGYSYVFEQFFDVFNATQIAGFVVAATFGTPIGAIAVFLDDIVIASVALNGFQEFNAAQQDAARYAMDQFEAVSGLSLSEQDEPLLSLEALGFNDGHADIRFAETATTQAPAFGIPPLERVEILLGEGILGDTWYVNDGTFDNPLPGTFAHWTILHEAGHAVGLKHTHETGLFGGRIPEDLEGFLTDVEGPILDASLDTLEFTVMTYTGDPETNDHPQSLMMLDIQAVQYLYGANFDYNAGDTTYSWDPATGQFFIDGNLEIDPAANRVFHTIWDGNGNDTYDLSNYTTGVNVNLLPGEWSTTATDQLATIDGATVLGNVANALLSDGDTRSLIENAIGGSGDDVISGNAADNLLEGGAGNDDLSGLEGDDTLDGGADDDTLDGGADNDSLIGGSGDDSITGGGGNDTVSAGDGRDIAFGGTGDDSINGGSNLDTLHGGAGNDTVSGGFGGDSITGGANDDLLLGDADDDTVVWTPARLREEMPTVEWRSPDTALPSEVLRLADTVASVVGSLRDAEVEIGGERGRVTDERVVLPEFETVLGHVDTAVRRVVDQVPVVPAIQDRVRVFDQPFHHLCVAHCRRPCPRPHPHQTRTRTRHWKISSCWVVCVGPRTIEASL